MNFKKVFAVLAVVATAGVWSFGSTHHHHLCDGFVEENDLWIADLGIMNNDGISEATFHEVLDRVEKLYTPVIAARGGQLRVVRNWSDGTVNAYARRLGRVYEISMFGGLARHPSITADGFALVACHEIGHHLGGAPKINNIFNRWASNEGQSDYYAGLKCLREFYTPESNLEWLEGREVSETVFEACTFNFEELQDQISCMRSSYAGLSVGYLFQDLRKENNPPQFHTPDTSVVSRTDDRHPATQCRLDTYFQGAICDRSQDEDLSDTNYQQGTCARTAGYSEGVRPLCWFAP